jgi:hypothetical protein
MAVSNPEGTDSEMLEGLRQETLSSNWLDCR